MDIKMKEIIWNQREYTKNELKNYLEHCRKKCLKTIKTLSDDKPHQHFKYGSNDLSFAELLLYNMRHVQHHTAQLNLILRQEIDSAPSWVKHRKNLLSIRFKNITFVPHISRRS